MRCRKCGHELSDDDIFCSRCGTKVRNGSSTQVDEKSGKERRLAKFIRDKLRQLSVDRTFIHQQFEWFLFCLVAFIIISLVLYVVSPNETVSNANRARYILSMLFRLPFFVPLMIGLFILREKSYWIEFLFSFMLLTEIDYFVVKGGGFSEAVAIIALIIGLLMLIVIACKKLFSK